MMTDESYLVHDKVGNVTSYVGPDATLLFRARTIRSGLKAWHKHKMLLTRNMTVTKLLSYAGNVTGKKYKKTEVEQAIVDLDVWILNMAAALPMVEA